MTTELKTISAKDLMNKQFPHIHIRYNEEEDAWFAFKKANAKHLIHAITDGLDDAFALAKMYFEDGCTVTIHPAGD